MLFMDPFRLTSSALTRPTAFLPAADVTVSDRDVVLTMDVPGLGENDLSIEFESGYLTVSGERALPQVGEGATYAHTERPFGKFERRIKLPDGVEPEKITASLTDGVLSLIVPKSEQLRPRTVQIETGKTHQRELETATA